MKKSDLALGIGGGLAGGVVVVFAVLWGADKVGRVIDAKSSDKDRLEAPLVDGPAPGEPLDIALSASSSGPVQLLQGYRIVGEADDFVWPNGAESYYFASWLALEGPDGERAYVDVADILFVREQKAAQNRSAEPPS